MREVYGIIHLPFLLSYRVLSDSHKPPPQFSTLQRSESLDEGTGASVDGVADHLQTASAGWKAGLFLAMIVARMFS